jgi:Rrf2 family cysteine metabolism transcriptional repressor
MKVSTKGRYGTRAMLDIALHSEDGLVHLKDVAERQEVSRKYLEQLIARLEASGLLRTIRGVGGGVALNRAPSEITVLDILHSLEGSTPLVDCVIRPELCSRSANCSARDLWSELGGAVSKFLGSVTLEDLCERQKAREEPAALTYQI